MASDTMTFIGKWAFSSTYGGSFMSLNESGGQLVAVSAQSPGPDQRFNAYGDVTSGFWLQGNNGSYVVYNGDGGYAATEARTGSPAIFTLKTTSGSVQLVEQASGESYYVDLNGNSVSRVSTDNAPATTLLLQVIVSPGLADIQAVKFAAAVDLKWAYLASANLASVSFQDADLSHADLSGCNLYGALFTGTDLKLSYALLAKATLSYAVMNNIAADNADFTNAVMTLTKLSDSNLDYSNLTGADMTNAVLNRTGFQNANLTGAKLYGATATDTRFDKANLTKADLTRAMITDFHIPGATLAYAKLDNQTLTTAEIDADTDFTGASMQNVFLSNCVLQEVTFAHANLTGARLDGADLTGADLSYANLTKASLKNGVKLYSVSLSNATLTSADLTGAQLGAISVAFTLSESLASDLDQGVVDNNIKDAFADAGHPLSSSATVTVRIPGENWIVTDGNTVYTITNDGAVLDVWMSTNTSYAAVLAGAYMPNAIFTSANLYAVNMSGVNWYGEAAKADNTNLEEADLANANLASMDFSQARMYGCNLDSANLINTNFNGAYLTASANKKQTSLAYSNMQGATFVQAHLQGAVLTNAAVSLNQGPFFNLPESYEANLNQGLISQDLREQFNKYGYPLESNAFVTVNILGSYWTITNGSNSVYPVYNIVNISNSLIVSGGPIGVHLFDLPQSMSVEFDQKKLSSDIQTAFKDNGYPLLPSAKIDKVIVPGSEWHMTNINTDTTKLQEGYGEFYVINNTVDASLHVYGSVLMFVRTGEDHTLEQVRMALATTQVTQDVMDGTTTCPNGQRLSQYLNQSPTQHITWEQMMTAATPPKPPACIPDPMHWC